MCSIAERYRDKFNTVSWDPRPYRSETVGYQCTGCQLLPFRTHNWTVCASAVHLIVSWALYISWELTLGSISILAAKSTRCPLMKMLPVLSRRCRPCELLWLLLKMTQLTRSTCSTPIHYIDIAVFSVSLVAISRLLRNWCKYLTAVVIYDWLLTFPDEILVIWRAKVTRAKVLFLLNRYLSIAMYITAITSNQSLGVNNAVSIYTWTHDTKANVKSTCRGVPIFQQLFRKQAKRPSHIAVPESDLRIMSLLCFIPWLSLVRKSRSQFQIRYMLMRCEIGDSAFQVHRVYAISGRMWQLAVLVGAFNIFPFSFAIVRSLLWA